MKYRATILYLVAALILAGIYFYDVHKEKKEDEAQITAKGLLDISSDQLDEIILTRGTQTIRLQKGTEPDKRKWKITDPVHAPADRLEIEDLKTRLVNMKYDRIIAEDAADLTRFGLEQPVFSINYKAGAKSGKLSFGSKTPLEDGHYVRKGDEKKIYLVAWADKNVPDKTLFELRDKRLFSLPGEKIKRLIIVSQKVSLTLIKKEGQWLLEDDQDFKIDGKRVESILRKFSWAEASSFEKETADDLSPFGLDRPRAVIILSDGEKSEEIQFGDPSKKNNKIYAKIKGKPQIVTVDKWLLSDLPQNRDDIKEDEPEKVKEKR